MRRVLLIAASLAAITFACRTSQPPGAENQMPLDGPGQEPIQTVPSEPPGPAGPLSGPFDGGTPG
jgi:hypothetical protein